MESSTEVLLISAVLTERDLSQPLQYGVEPQHFLAHEDEWQWIVDYARQHKQLPSKALFRSTWPDFTLKKADDVGYLSQKLLEDYSKHLIYRAIDDAAGGLFDEASATTISAQLLADLTQVSKLTAQRGAMSLPRDTSEAVSAFATAQQKLKEKGNAGIQVGFPTIDNLTGGAMPGELWIVGARLGSYKSTTLMRMGLHAARNGHNVLFFALEMARLQVTHRLHSMHSGLLYAEEKSKLLLDPTMLRTGRGLRLNDYRSWTEVADEDLSGKFDVVDTGRGLVSPSTIRGYLERDDYDLVMVDYLTLLHTAQGHKKDDWQNVAQLSAELKGITGEYELPIISAAQLNRADGVSKRSGFSYMPPGPESIGRADAIGQDADLVITQGKATKHALRVRIAKSRHTEDGDLFWVHADLRNGVFEEVGQHTIEKVIERDEDELYGEKVADKKAQAGVKARRVVRMSQPKKNTPGKPKKKAIRVVRRNA